MRIDQMVRSYTLQSQFSAAQTTTPNTTPSPGLTAAKQANQARLSDAGKGYTQATKVRDGVAAVSTALGQASSLVDKAKSTTLSAADRSQLQKDLGKALAAVDQGVKDQTTALADKTLTNKTFDAKRATTTAANQLGDGKSQQFTSVADLKKLDLSTATPDQLAEAAKVLSAAQSETGAQLGAANRQVDRVSGQVNTLQNTENALEGTTTTSTTTPASTATTRQQLNLQAAQALAQQGTSTLIPGSLFSSIG